MELQHWLLLTMQSITTFMPLTSSNAICLGSLGEENAEVSNISAMSFCTWDPLDDTSCCQLRERDRESSNGGIRLEDSAYLIDSA
jgi:hypothetical protein